MVEKVVVVKMLIDRENVADITGVHVCANMFEGMWLLLCSGCRGHCFCFVEYFE